MGLFFGFFWGGGVGGVGIGRGILVVSRVSVGVDGVRDGMMLRLGLIYLVLWGSGFLVRGFCGFSIFLGFSENLR